MSSFEPPIPATPTPVPSRRRVPPPTLSISRRGGRPRSLPAALLLAAAPALLALGCDRAARPEQVAFVEGLSAEEIEARHPLSAEARAELTPENVEALAQWEIDQLYARLTAGPIPDGPYQGRFFFAEGGGPKKLSARLGPVSRRVADLKLEKLDRLGETLWKGKVFFEADRELRNMIDNEELVADLFDVSPDRLRKATVDGREVALLFPAELYCGESLSDPRRESVIIDYANTDSIDGYVPEIDRLAGRDGLAIRDEIRIVRPGFYLGRAYADGRLLLTFTLWQEETAEAGGDWVEECETGAPAPPVAAGAVRPVEASPARG